MARAKQASKRKRSRQALPVWGAAGMSLAMAGGASAAVVDGAKTSPQQTLPVITLGEEELSDVILSKFFVYDREATASSRLGEKLRANGAAAAAAAGAPADAAVLADAEDAPLPDAAEAADAAEDAPWSADAASASASAAPSWVAPAAAAAAACRGDPASSARRERFPTSPKNAVSPWVDQTGRAAFCLRRATRVVRGLRIAAGRRSTRSSDPGFPARLRTPRRHSCNPENSASNGNHEWARQGSAGACRPRDRRSRGTPLHSIARTFRAFAPNFTVYLLPPDAVCLYSEHRKFFLYGELYCALASTIGEGGWSIGELVRGLERNFPADKIREALTRLFDRGYILPTSPASTGVVAAYWASLGLSPQAVHDGLQTCRVRIQSIDVLGAKEFSAALSRLGVRVVQRAPDLTIVLVRDYLDGRLAELNKRHLADRTRWLLVQPAGIFPLVGPVFAPARAPAGPAFPIACGATARSGECSTAARRASCRLRRSPGSHSDNMESSLQPSRSRRRSPRVLRRS